MWVEGGGINSEFTPVYHPAGADSELRLVVEELQAGRWMAMRDLLRRTRHAAARTWRTQVMGIVAARSDVVQVWQAEEPANTDALAMNARVRVERALQAHRQRHPSTAQLEKAAREACHQAMLLLPDDVVPWVCLLALAQLDESQELVDHRQAPPEQLLPPGPWRLLSEAHSRDPYNREAFHRTMQFLQVRRAGSWADTMDYVSWVVSLAPAGSALLAMPLYAHVEFLRRQWEHGSTADPLVRRQWVLDHIRRDVQQALYGWFEQADPATYSATDLNYLAHALWAGNQFHEAARTFAAIGVNATWLPWAHVADEPELSTSEFLRARAQSYAAGRRRPDTRP
ncbi:hypothetical protein [Streptomyces griseorubiginosus]|uniref:hypothetical protein n=1 Tax=Streptomyces griseorubiginosus TaxID=67304 RepID=UPI0036EE8FA4